MRQPDLFAAPRPAPEPRAPNLTYIRKSLKGYLRLARDAEILPWNEPQARMLSWHFPALARALPPEEGAELCAAFAAELERLGLRKPA